MGKMNSIPSIQPFDGYNNDRCMVWPMAKWKVYAIIVCEQKRSIVHTPELNEKEEDSLALSNVLITKLMGTKVNDTYNTNDGINTLYPRAIYCVNDGLLWYTYIKFCIVHMRSFYYYYIFLCMNTHEKNENAAKFRSHR